MLDTIEKNGVANLVAEMLTRGTANRTPAEFQEAIADLGAQINTSVGADALSISGRTLARNFVPVMELLEEMLTEPRWDAFEFDLAKSQALDTIVTNQANLEELATRASAFVTYGGDDIRAHSVLGSQSSVASLTLEDLKSFFSKNVSPEVSSLRIVGSVSEAAVTTTLSGLADSWTQPAPSLPKVSAPDLPEDAAVYFYDVPGAKQSIFNFSHIGPIRTDKDFYPVTVANYILGGGGFASRLTQQLRETKGYTYSIFSRFTATEHEGVFNILSQIRSNVTYEATALIREILSQYGNTFSDHDLATTKSFYINSKARSFESFSAKLGLLANIDRYDLPYDYVLRENEIVEAMAVDEMRRLIATYIKPEQMRYVIVGDGETQVERLNGLGLGSVTVLNEKVDALSR